MKPFNVIKLIQVFDVSWLSLKFLYNKNYLMSIFLIVQLYS